MSVSLQNVVLTVTLSTCTGVNHKAFACGFSRVTLLASLCFFLRIVKVTFSGAVEGRAVWPSDYKPVAWHDDADKVMFKLGLYHIKNKVCCCM